MNLPEDLSEEDLITLSDFLQYLDRDLTFLDGMAQGIDCVPLKNRVQAMTRNLKEFIESNNLRGSLPWMRKPGKKSKPALS